MRIVKLLVVISFLLCGFGSCGKKMDVYTCVLDTRTEDGLAGELEQWEMFCINHLTGDEKHIPIQDATKCIRENNNDCKWEMTDSREAELIRKECGK